MTNTGPEPLSEVLARLFASRGWGRREGRRRLEEAWEKAVGPALAKETQLGGLRRGILEVLVGNSVLLQEFAGFRKRELLAAIQEEYAAAMITDLRFRIGTFEEKNLKLEE